MGFTITSHDDISQLGNNNAKLWTEQDATGIVPNPMSTRILQEFKENINPNEHDLGL